MNTVRRACELLAALKQPTNGSTASVVDNKRVAPRASAAAPADRPKLVLLHSRFRPGDRRQAVEAALAPPNAGGTIVVSMQVIEAGVDVSATTLFTEVAPWPSLMQRFGRCNRRGEENEHGAVRWIDIPDKDAAPYDQEDLKEARRQLQVIEKKPEDERDVGLRWLPDMPLGFEHTHVIRCKDLIDLFDTTPDLAGNDIDIDWFVREIEDSDVRVFWRDWPGPKGHEPPPDDEPAPRREELRPR